MSAENIRNGAGVAAIATAAPANFLTENAATITISISICTLLVFAIASAVNSYANIKRNSIAIEAAKTDAEEHRRKIIEEIIAGAKESGPDVEIIIKNHFGSDNNES